MKPGHVDKEGERSQMRLRGRNTDMPGYLQYTGFKYGRTKVGVERSSSLVERGDDMTDQS